MESRLKSWLYQLSPGLFQLTSKIYGMTFLARTRRRKASEKMRETIKDRNAKARDLLADFNLSCDRILAGPFSGMNYQALSVGSLLAPKILGGYESQLHGWVRDAVAASYRIILDLGCAEGFYAVGLARLSPRSEIIASDTDPEALKAVRSLSELNSVSGRIKIIGRLNHQGLQQLLQPGALIFSDIEGAEIELLDPSKVPVLKYCDLIAELHEAQVPGVMNCIVDRFVTTHKIEAVWPESISERLRQLTDQAILLDAPESVRRELIEEGRPHNQCWVRMLSRSNIQHA